MAGMALRHENFFISNFQSTLAMQTQHKHPCNANGHHNTAQMHENFFISNFFKTPLQCRQTP